jgi:hypothetical protein
MSSGIEEMSIVVKDLKDHYKERIELGYIRNTYILNSIITVGKKGVIVDYLHQTGTNSPVIVLKPGPVLDVYKTEFERMWALAEKME